MANAAVYRGSHCLSAMCGPYQPRLGCNLCNQVVPATLHTARDQSQLPPMQLAHCKPTRHITTLAPNSAIGCPVDPNTAARPHQNHSDCSSLWSPNWCMVPHTSDTAGTVPVSQRCFACYPQLPTERFAAPLLATDKPSTATVSRSGYQRQHQQISAGQATAMTEKSSLRAAQKRVHGILSTAACVRDRYQRLRQGMAHSEAVVRPTATAD
jgi:hypothetical protein